MNCDVCTKCTGILKLSPVEYADRCLHIDVTCLLLVKLFYNIVIKLAGHSIECISHAGHSIAKFDDFSLCDKHSIS